MDKKFANFAKLFLDPINKAAMAKDLSGTEYTLYLTNCSGSSIFISRLLSFFGAIFFKISCVVIGANNFCGLQGPSYLNRFDCTPLDEVGDLYG